MKKLLKPILPPIVVYYCWRCGEQLKPSIYEKWFDFRSGEQKVNFIWKCPNKGLFNFLVWHTDIKTAEDGTELSEYSGM